MFARRRQHLPDGKGPLLRSVRQLPVFGIKLTTVSTEVKTLGVKAAEILLERIEKKEEFTEGDEVKRIILSPKIEKKGSEKFCGR